MVDYLIIQGIDFQNSGYNEEDVVRNSAGILQLLVELTRPGTSRLGARSAF
ncbi:MAG: hypothetical protein M1421_00845 [Candidatus Eremiobacteraeota bacterium]|nr:hypothetical protein [Candidatus Eremiobacteraeota bacterium]